MISGQNSCLSTRSIICKPWFVNPGAYCAISCRWVGFWRSNYRIIVISLIWPLIVEPLKIFKFRPNWTFFGTFDLSLSESLRHFFYFRWLSKFDRSNKENKFNSQAVGMAISEMIKDFKSLRLLKLNWYLAILLTAKGFFKKLYIM